VLRTPELPHEVPLGQGQEVASCAQVFSFRRDRDYAPKRTVGHPLVEAPTQPPEGSEVSTCASAVGPARAPNDRTKGGPTGTTELPGGVVRFAVGADCCGALSCHETDGLLKVEQDGETRTLCPVHARRWLK